MARQNKWLGIHGKWLFWLSLILAFILLREFVLDVERRFDRVKGGE